MARGVLTLSVGNRQREQVSPSLERDGATLERQQCHGAPGTERPGQHLALQRRDDALRPRQLALQDRSRPRHPPHTGGHGRQIGPSRTQSHELHFPKLAREAVVPHGHDVIDQLVAGAPGPGAGEDPGLAFDLELEQRLQVRGIHQPPEPARGLALASQGGRQIQLGHGAGEALARRGEGDGHHPPVVRTQAEAAGHVAARQRAVGGVVVDVAVESVRSALHPEAPGRRGVDELLEKLGAGDVPLYLGARRPAHSSRSPISRCASATRVRIPLSTRATPAENTVSLLTRSKRPDSRYQ